MNYIYVLEVLVLVFICSIFGAALFTLICYVAKIGIFDSRDSGKKR